MLGAPCTAKFTTISYRTRRKFNDWFMQFPQFLVWSDYISPQTSFYFVSLSFCSLQPRPLRNVHFQNVFHTCWLAGSQVTSEYYSPSSSHIVIEKCGIIAAYYLFLFFSFYLTYRSRAKARVLYGLMVSWEMEIIYLVTIKQELTHDYEYKKTRARYK